MHWYSRMGSRERRTFWACFGGWALDAMDVQIYSFVIPTLTVLWSITPQQAGLLATSALLISAFGGWVSGLLADRLGRVRLLQITIIWFAAFTFLSGLTTGFYSLIIVRGLQGFGFGGEWAAGAVLMGETAATAERGRAVGTVQAGWAVGWGMAALLATTLMHFLPPAIAWRVLFFVGVLPAFFVFFLRRYVEEPPIFQDSRKNAPATLWEIFSPRLLRTTLLGSFLALGAQGGYYAITTWLPTLLRDQHHLTVLETGGYLAVIISGSFCGYLVGAWLTDALGRRPNFFLFAVCSFVTVLVYTMANISDAAMLILGFPLGFFASGLFSGMGPLYTELYPTRVRACGQGFCYNFGRGCAALFPALVGALSERLTLGAAIGTFAAMAYAIVIVAALSLPETRGTDLAALD